MKRKKKSENYLWTRNADFSATKWEWKKEKRNKRVRPDQCLATFWAYTWDVRSNNPILLQIAANRCWILNANKFIEDIFSLFCFFCVPFHLSVAPSSNMLSYKSLHNPRAYELQMKTEKNSAPEGQNKWINFVGEQTQNIKNKKSALAPDSLQKKWCSARGNVSRLCQYIFPFASQQLFHYSILFLSGAAEQNSVHFFLSTSSMWMMYSPLPPRRRRRLCGFLFYICIFQLISCVCINRMLASHGWLRERKNEMDSAGWIPLSPWLWKFFKKYYSQPFTWHQIHIIIMCECVHVHRVSVFTQISGERFPFGIVALQELTFATSYNGLYDLAALETSKHLVAQSTMWMPTTLLTSSHMCMQNWITECVQRGRKRASENIRMRTES